MTTYSYTDMNLDITTQNNYKIKSYNKLILDIRKIKKIDFSSAPYLSFESADSILFVNSSHEEYIHYCSDVNFISYKFQEKNKYVPTIHTISDIINVSAFINNLFKYYTIPQNSYIKTTFNNYNENSITALIICFKQDLIMLLQKDYYCTLFYNKEKYEKSTDSMLYTILGLLKNNIRPKVSKNKIYIVYRNSHGFDKMGFDIKKTHISIKENYNDEFLNVSENIIAGLNNKNKTHLVILSGLPGVGKTTYIRYLTSKLKKNVIFISPDMVDAITDPGFIPFLMNNNDSILIIEDAEPALEKRINGSRSSAVSNILNLTDGLLSDCLNISIVATFNTDKKTLDEALLRKGRLLMNYKFEKLCIDKSKELLEKLGHKDVEVTEPMALSDIYFYGTDNNIKTPKHKKIGFTQ